MKLNLISLIYSALVFYTITSVASQHQVPASSMPSASVNKPDKLSTASSSGVIAAAHGAQAKAKVDAQAPATSSATSTATAPAFNPDNKKITINLPPLLQSLIAKEAQEPQMKSKATAQAQSTSTHQALAWIPSQGQQHVAYMSFLAPIYYKPTEAPIYWGIPNVRGISIRDNRTITYRKFSKEQADDFVKSITIKTNTDETLSYVQEQNAKRGIITIRYKTKTPQEQQEEAVIDLSIWTVLYEKDSTQLTLKPVNEPQTWPTENHSKLQRPDGYIAVNGIPKEFRTDVSTSQLNEKEALDTTTPILINGSGISVYTEENHAYFSFANSPEKGKVDLKKWHISHFDKNGITLIPILVATRFMHIPGYKAALEYLREQESMNSKTNYGFQVPAATASGNPPSLTTFPGYSAANTNEPWPSRPKTQVHYAGTAKETQEEAWRTMPAPAHQYAEWAPSGDLQGGEPDVPRWVDTEQEHPKVGIATYKTPDGYRHVESDFELFIDRSDSKLYGIYYYDSMSKKIKWNIKINRLNYKVDETDRKHLIFRPLIWIKIGNKLIAISAKK
jgi:hypothetical protein